MKLTLDIIGPQAAQLGKQAHKEFIDNGGSIGRSPDNDWSIGDSYISGRHARIHFRNGRFFVVDTSANGTSLRTRANRLTQGQWYPLNDQDRLFLDTVELRVSITEDQPAVTPPPPPSNTVGVEHTQAFGYTTPLDMPADAVLAALFDAPGASHAERHNAATAVESPARQKQRDEMPDRTESMSPNDIEPEQDAQAAYPRTQVLNPGVLNPESLSPGPRASVTHDKPIAQPGPGVDFVEVFTPVAHTSAAQPPPDKTPATLSETQSSDLDTRQLKALFSSAGIAADAVTPEMLTTLTEVLRATLSGLLELQQQREATKDTFRLSTTRFKPAENNPLRFSANVDDALYNLLVKRNPAYLSPLAAIRGSFADAHLHQQAMLQAARAVCVQLLDYFDPDTLARETGGVRKALRWFASGEDARWTHFKARHAALAGTNNQDTDAVFNELFGRCYEEALAALRNPRKDA